MKLKTKPYVEWFRDSSPYINAHRQKTFVLYLGGEVFTHSNFENIVSDIALLNSLGVRLVLVHGATPQIDSYLEKHNINCRYHNDARITDDDTQICVEDAVGRLRLQIEARLSMGLINSPMHGAEIKVISGNFIKAKPLGIHDGVDYLHSGELRSVDTITISKQLEDGAIILLSPIGYSLTGEIFNLCSMELATGVAIALSADKLIYFGSNRGVLNENEQVISELQPTDLHRLIEAHGSHEGSPNGSPNGLRADTVKQLRLADTACQAGVSRCHLISFAEDGALLEEMFTRDGSGTQVCMESYEQIRSATVEDVGGIIELIRPLEEKGILVRRSRELLETEVDRFTVIIRDGMIVGCTSLYPYNGKGELACLATHPDYRNSDRGELLLRSVERDAKELGLTELFVLTTQSAHWFKERGFVAGDLADLPAERKLLYNFQRNSSVFCKRL
ncbi:MAG: amino-acid N-acetyltransferase [Pseudomonadales bacterium]|nr:amino-acid N-acetyltransferase [Pseudomonadales bacterium]MDP7596533.1 amino-acid N-acetyltransferase [Pseudomonadales bacterium]HJN50246.1 amino-acid N-acetyltransferase [Pseudomonadales bacterium]